MKTDMMHPTLSFWSERDTVHLQIVDQLAAHGLLTLEGKVNGDSLHIALQQQPRFSLGKRISI